MMHIEITHIGRDEHGRRVPPFEWCAVKCDGCGDLMVLLRGRAYDFSAGTSVEDAVRGAVAQRMAS